MKTLVHICCAPCLLGPLDELQGAGFTGYFYNPNIHGLIEFRRRLKAVRVLADQRKFALQVDEDYGLSHFLDQVDWRLPSPQRCRACYRLRLSRTALAAREGGYGAFSTTLLVSWHQPHDVLREVAEQVAAESGVPFAYHDWRETAEDGQAQAARMSIYRQSYCGCIFSEQDRYQATRLHCYKGDSGPADQK